MHLSEREVCVMVFVLTIPDRFACAHTHFVFSGSGSNVQVYHISFISFPMPGKYINDSNSMVNV